MMTFAAVMIAACFCGAAGESEYPISNKEWQSPKEHFAIRRSLLDIGYSGVLRGSEDPAVPVERPRDDHARG